MSSYQHCDLCHQEPHISKRITVDWNGTWIYVGQECLDRFGEYAISCSTGSLRQAREIAERQTLTRQGAR